MKRKMVILALFLVVALIIALAAFSILHGFSTPKDDNGKNNNEQVGGDKLSSEDIDKETKKLIEEVKKASKESVTTSDEKQVVGQVVTFTNGEKVEEAVVVAPNSNPISVDTGKVLTHDGLKSANNAASYVGDSDAPLQSDPIRDVSALPSNVIKINANPDSMTPNRIEVRPGQAVALVVTSGASPIIFKFDDPSLSAVAMGLRPQETREITFNAPSNPGNYLFFSDYPGHRAAGSEGVMIVK
jgi:plastocyanin